MIKVFHKKSNFHLSDVDSMCMDLITKYNRNDFSDKFDLVACVDTNNLNVAKCQTTHIDCNWWDNEGLESSEEIGLISNARSTKKGDILITKNGSFLVEDDGFTELRDLLVNFNDIDFKKLDYEKIAI